MIKMSKERDILFVYTNVNGFHQDTYSFGIGYLSAVLKNNGFYPTLEVVKSRKDYKKVLKTVLEIKPKVVGFTSVSSQFVFVSELATMIKKIHNCIIVCGGVHPTIFPDCLFSAPALDGVFIGESELSFLDFVKEVKNGNDYKKVDNFCYINYGELIKNKLRPRIENLDLLPLPDRDIYDYQSIIDETDGMAKMISSRGCPFHCTYCSNHALAGIYGQKSNTIRYNSVERALQEVESLKNKYRFQRLYFSDDIFILNRQWLDLFLTKYKKRFKIPFMCHIKPAVTTKDILLKLKEAGCYRVFLAIESANNHIRNILMKRAVTKSQLENNFHWAKEVGVETQSVNIIGVPGETEETILETIELNRKVNPTLVGVSIFSPYEGTELGDYCRTNGLLRKTNSRYFSDRRDSRLNLPTISNRRLMRLYDRFQYLIYKDIDPIKARKAFWRSYYGRLEQSILFGYFFRRFRKTAILIGKKLVVNQSQKIQSGKQREGK